MLRNVRKLRINLKHLLLLTLVSAAAAWYVRIYIRQAQAVRGLRQAGASVTYVRDVDGKQILQAVEDVLGDDLVYSVQSICINGDTAGADPKQFSRNLRKIAGFKRLVMENLPVDQALLRHIAVQDSLEQLSLTNVGLVDEDLVSLGNLTSLAFLNLSRNPVRRIAPLKLGALPALQEVWLDSTRVTGKDLSFIAGSNVEYLTIRNTPVNYDGFDAIRKPNSLRTVFVDNNFAPCPVISSIESTTGMLIVSPSDLD